MKSLWIVAALAATGLATQADAFRSINGDRVNAINGSVFEVIPKGAARTTDIWCSASQFARRELGADWQQKVYLVQGYGPSVTTNRRTAVQFTLDPQAAGVRANDRSVQVGFRPGDSLSVQRGETYCAPAGPGRFIGN